jgi:hypothetical protein
MSDAGGPFTRFVPLTKLDQISHGSAYVTPKGVAKSGGNLWLTQTWPQLFNTREAAIR